MPICRPTGGNTDSTTAVSISPGGSGFSTTNASPRRPLPDYPIARIRTGQWLPADDQPAMASGFPPRPVTPPPGRGIIRAMHDYPCALTPCPLIRPAGIAPSAPHPVSGPGPGGMKFAVTPPPASPCWTITALAMMNLRSAHIASANADGTLRATATAPVRVKLPHEPDRFYGVAFELPLLTGGAGLWGCKPAATYI